MITINSELAGITGDEIKVRGNADEAEIEIVAVDNGQDPSRSVTTLFTPGEVREIARALLAVAEMVEPGGSHD